MKGPNYIKSIFIHIAALLLLLAFSFRAAPEHKEPYQHVITVDFSKEVTVQASANKSAPRQSATRSKATKPKPKIQAPSSKTPASTPIQEKSQDKTELPTSQKPKVVPPMPAPKPDPGPTPEELAAQKRAKELAAKRSKFADLLSKSSKKPSVDSSEGESEEPDGNHGQEDAVTSANGNIKGVLGNRQVLKVPTIKDDSQKKGRVVVKFCVNADGNVISSVYTMMGSTTSDTYLIKLAEEGVKSYKFSSSPNPKECGKVVINFLLK